MIDDIFNKDETWQTYRTHKRLITLPGKPHLIHQKFPLKVDAVNENIFELKPDLAAIAWSDLEAVGQNQFVMQDHNFKAEGWKTTLKHFQQNESNFVLDGNMWTFGNSCPCYNKPLEDPELRFTPEAHDNIETINCDQFTFELFKKKHLNRLVPLKIVGCKKSKLDLKEAIWNGLLYNGEETRNFASMIEMQRQSSMKSGFHIDAVSDMKEDFFEEMFPSSNSIEGEVILKAEFKSEGRGKIIASMNQESFFKQIDGTKWWVITPAGYNRNIKCVDYSASYKKGETNVQEGFWETAAWFNQIQPQLCFKTYFGRQVIMTLQNPGDIIYVPPHCQYSYYSTKDSLSAFKGFVSPSS